MAGHVRTLPLCRHRKEIYLMLYKKIKKYINYKILRCKPTQVVIETTNRCNLNCPFCLVGMQNELLDQHGSTSHDLMSRTQGSMSPETFDTVRKRLRDFGIKKASLHFQGEPFLNKNTSQFARLLKSDGLYVGVFTNGQAFTDQIIEEIADVEIGLIRFSVDGASEETYTVNRVGGTFEKVFENMKKVVKAHAGKKTRIEWQFLALKNNEHEINTARQMAKEININFFVKGFRETNPELAPVNPEYKPHYLKKPCSDIYKQLGIYWNGDVVPCCYDVDGKEIMGNAVEQSLKEIWNSDKYRDFRSKVDNSKKQSSSEPLICKNCLRWQ